jgi:hypothetical protein
MTPETNGRTKNEFTKSSQTKKNKNKKKVKVKVKQKQKPRNSQHDDNETKKEIRKGRSTAQNK